MTYLAHQYIACGGSHGSTSSKLVFSIEKKETFISLLLFGLQGKSTSFNLVFANLISTPLLCSAYITVDRVCRYAAAAGRGRHRH